MSTELQLSCEMTDLDLNAEIWPQCLYFLHDKMTSNRPVK